MGRLIDSLGDCWFAFCMTQLGRSELAREAAQETALRFIRTIGRFEGRSQVKTWSLGIALNVCREMRAARRPMRLVDEAQADVPADDERLGELEQSEATARLREVVAALPGRQREAVVLRFFEGLSVEQTAAAMQCSPGTVKATVFQALRKLKELLPT